MFGRIFITRAGYDPQQGKHIKDPYLGDNPSIGACRPDIRKSIVTGGQIFVISGRVRGIPQFVMGGLEVAEKIPMIEAYERFPEQRLRRREDGQLAGNVVLNASGEQHELDNHDLGKHDKFQTRIDNYIVGCKPIALVTDQEIGIGREETLEALQDIFKKNGNRPYDILGRAGRNLTELQAERLRDWLLSIKRRSA